MTIRKAKPSDAKQVHKIYFDPVVHKFMHYNKMGLREFRKKWKMIMAKCETYIFETKGRAVAFGWLDKFDGMRSHVIEISHIAVSPSEQGKGIGKKLFSFLLKKAKSKNAKRVQLIAEVDNKKAIAFYKKFGFVKEGRLRKSFKRTNGYVDQIVMSKLL